MSPLHLLWGIFLFAKKFGMIYSWAEKMLFQISEKAWNTGDHMDEKLMQAWQLFSEG